MATDLVFPGSHSHLLADFVEHKRSLGFGYEDRMIRAVHLLARHIDTYPHTDQVITAQMVEAFLDPAGKKPATTWKRRCLVTQLAYFLRERGIDCWRPPDHFDAMPVAQFVPRIITAEEMARLINAADRLPEHHCSPKAGLVYGLLLRVLWCLGTRIGETLALTTRDVNTTDAVITIRRAKGNKTRLIPMSKSLRAFTIDYLQHTGIALDPGAWLFPSIYGGHLSHPAVVHRVHKLMLQAGITTDDGRPARIHDIRHSYAVAALAKMQTEGMDPYTCLPLLATIMGHGAIRHTEYYLRLTGPAQAQIAACDTLAYPSIYPQVN